MNTPVQCFLREAKKYLLQLAGCEEGWSLVKTAKVALETEKKGSSAESQNFKALAKMSLRSHNNETVS